MSTSNQYQVITIAPGQKVYIPNNANIVSITKDGDANVSSDCIDLSKVEEVKCYVFYWASGHEGSHDVFDEDHTNVKSFTILGVEYNMNISVGNPNGVYNKISDNAPYGLITWIDVNEYADTGQADRYGILFKTTPSVAATMKMTFEATDGFFRGNIDIYPTLEEDCTVHE